MTPYSIEDAAAERQLRESALAAATWKLPTPHDVRYLETAINAQARVFMADIFTYLAPYLRTLKWGTNLTILDVGAGSAAGTAWLADTLSGSFLGVTARVDALEVNDIYIDYAKVFYPHVRYISGKLLSDLPPKDSWDIVLASHVIEHVDAPEGFVEELRARATRRVFVYAPFAEPRNRLADGHVNSFTTAQIESWKPEKISYLKSLGWRKDVGDTDDQCFLAEFRGAAK